MPPTARRQYGVYRPGAPKPPDNANGMDAPDDAPDDAPAQPPAIDPPYTYTYAESDYPYDAPNTPNAPDRAEQAPRTPYPDDGDGDDQP